MAKTPRLVLLALGGLAACSQPAPWPASPLVSVPAAQPDAAYPQSAQEARAALAGHYAHFDVVAYEDTSTDTPMRTFIVSYGFTDFAEEEGHLVQVDDFCTAVYALNQKSVQTSFSPEAVAAIEPRTTEVQLSQEDGLWRIYRPETPVLLGITGDPSQPLSQNPDDPAIIDADGDGRPGVTVHLHIGGFLKGELYIARREIYRDHLTLLPDGRVFGRVEDLSEQLVIDANMRILRQPSNNTQVDDPGLNPVLLVPVDAQLDTCEELAEQQDALFPPAPTFF